MSVNQLNGVFRSSHPYRRAWWLPGSHLQTLWPSLFYKVQGKTPANECFITVDGDFIDLHREGDPSAPLVFLLHGLTGSQDSGYMIRLRQALRKIGWQTLTINFRGCSGRPNNKALAYHSGDTRDLDNLYRQVRASLPDIPIAMVGFSLGGNVLLKWLGESGTADLFAACAVSVPFRLDLCADRLDLGFSRIYRDRLLKELNEYNELKLKHLVQQGYQEEADKLLALGNLRDVKSFWEYDSRVVARLYGYENAADYYRQCSSRRFIGSIKAPTLIIHADDDPFMMPSAVPDPDELSPTVHLELTRGGGHVGFIAGKQPNRPEFWLNQRIPEFFLRAFDHYKSQNHQT